MDTAQTLSYGSATTTFATGTTNNATLSTPVTVDVDALIKNSSASFGWRVTRRRLAGDRTNPTFATSENTNAGRRPQLVINYEK